ncbi:MAG: hypothetical protein RLZZ507_2790 [Cyanobacteriota bacterium]|jgi:hypothetical protein
MFLYHGTSFEYIERIRSQGVLPSRETKKSNWNTPESNNYESRNDAVYLSDAYSPYYAFHQYYKRLLEYYKRSIELNSLNLKQTSNKLTTVSSKLALIEIDTNSLEQDKFYPDEDFLVKSNLPCKIGETEEERIEYFKENLEYYQDYLKDSLEKMGNCCYFGVIPPTAISRITKWCCKDVDILKTLSYDYVDHKGVFPFYDQEDSQILRLLTQCFAKREFQLDELLFLCKTKFKLDDNFDYDKTKDILIQEIEKIEIVCDKDCDTI